MRNMGTANDRSCLPRLLRVSTVAQGRGCAPGLLYFAAVQPSPVLAASADPHGTAITVTEPCTMSSQCRRDRAVCTQGTSAPVGLGGIDHQPHLPCRRSFRPG